MRIHVLTAVSRPGNLPRVAESLAAAAQNAPHVDVSWHWRFDLERRHVGGQALKNAMLDEITDGWVWILDDDTLVHPELFVRLREHVDADPLLEALVVSQHRADGVMLTADPANVRVGGIDAGQAIMRRSLIGTDRLPIDYNGDGMWLERVLSRGRVVYVPEVLSFHNALGAG